MSGARARQVRAPVASPSGKSEISGADYSAADAGRLGYPAADAYHPRGPRRPVGRLAVNESAGRECCSRPADTRPFPSKGRLGPRPQVC